MLDLERLRSIELHAAPRGHKVVGTLLLGPNYNIPPRTRISVEGRENLPEEPVVLAMNHTDRYNYWPFQYWLWRHEKRFTATWVKGKYYENKWVGRFMEMTNNIPAPSRGYVMTRDFVNTIGRPPTTEEYSGLRDIAAGGAVADGVLPEAIVGKSRDMLGRRYNPSSESYSQCLTALMQEMNEVFIELNEEAFSKGLHLLIFPQGTRSIRLSKGHIGLVQAALRFKRGILPIGCNGSDKVYPGGSPWAKRGNIVYRVGELMEYESFSEHHLPEGVDPFDPNISAEHRESMQALVDTVMLRINALVDPQYQFGDDGDSDGVQGAKRFV